MPLADVVAARLEQLRAQYPHARSDAWASLVVDAVRRYADEGPEERLEVASLAGLAILPKMSSESGRLRAVRTEQILVTPRAQAKKRASRAARA